MTWDYAGKSSVVATNGTGGSATTTSVPSALSRISGGAMRFNWPSVAGKIYRVAYKNDLRDATWTDLSGNITATGATSSWTDSTTAGVSKRFYIVYVTN